MPPCRRAFGDSEPGKTIFRQMHCLQPADVANAILWCLACPAHMEVNDVVIRPTEQLI